MDFVLCPSCTRHVKSSETNCPFCRSPLEGAQRSGNAKLRGARTRRRAMFGVAAGIVAGTAAACTNDDSMGSSFYGVACADDACAPFSDASASDGSPAAFYGVAFTDSGSGDASDDASLDASDDAPDGDS